MRDTVQIFVDGEAHDVPSGAMLASALLALRVRRFRDSVSGEPRAPLCGMGGCQECRVTVDGHAQTRSCMVVCSDGMRVKTR